MIAEFLPAIIQSNLAVIGLLLVGFFAEKHYVGRLTAFSNGIAVNVYYLDAVGGFIFSLYAALGFIVAVVGFLFYLDNTSLGEHYYLVTYFGYSSATAALVILLPNSWYGVIFSILLGGIINAGLLELLEERAIAH